MSLQGELAALKDSCTAIFKQRFKLSLKARNAMVYNSTKYIGKEKNHSIQIDQQGVDL
jgi:hypothetical protein